MVAQKNRNTEPKSKGRNVEPLKRTRNKNVEAPPIEPPAVVYTILPMPPGAGDWICNGKPENYASGLYADQWPIVQGPPRQTQKYNVDNLVQKGLVGIYFAKRS